MDREQASQEFEQYIGLVACNGVPAEFALEVASKLEDIRKALCGDEPVQGCEYCGVEANGNDGKFNEDGLFCCIDCIGEYAMELEDEKWVS